MTFAGGDPTATPRPIDTPLTGRVLRSNPDAVFLLFVCCSHGPGTTDRTCWISTPSLSLQTKRGGDRAPSVRRTVTKARALASALTTC